VRELRMTKKSPKIQEESAETRGRTLDHAATLYDTVGYIFSLGQTAFHFKKTIEALQICETDTILDVGCGTGVLQGLLSPLLPRGKIVGIDAAAKMIQVARKKRSFDNVIFTVAAAEKLPYEDNSFDKVCSLFFFHHVDYELKVLAVKEIRRVLKPGGIFVVTDIDKPTNFFGKWCLFCGETLFRQPEIGENRKGMLPFAFRDGGFKEHQLLGHWLGYNSIYKMSK